MSTCANTKLEEIRIAGKTLYVPSTDICGRTVVVTGKWIRTAQIKDEDVVKGVTVEDPDLLISKDEHYDKRPANALIAKAAEVCEQKGISHLIYTKFVYGNKRRSSLLEFKRRNGFQQVNFPRYYVPLTLRGEVFVRLRLYRGLSGLIPEPILQPLLSFRAWYCKAISIKPTLQHKKFAGVAQR